MNQYAHHLISIANITELSQLPLKSSDVRDKRINDRRPGLKITLIFTFTGTNMENLVQSFVPNGCAKAGEFKRLSGLFQFAFAFFKYLENGHP
jgi:hypothetical protein